MSAPALWNTCLLFLKVHWAIYTKNLSESLMTTLCSANTTIPTIEVRNLQPSEKGTGILINVLQITQVANLRFEPNLHCHSFIILLHIVCVQRIAGLGESFPSIKIHLPPCFTCSWENEGGEKKNLLRLTGKSLESKYIISQAGSISIPLLNLLPRFGQFLILFIACY